MSTQKSVKFVCSSRSTRASQSLLMVEKQSKSTPDMLNPPRHIAGRGMYNIPTWTFIVIVTTISEFCEDSVESQTTSINAFLCHRFFTLSVPVLLFNVSEWRRYRLKTFAAAKVQQKNDTRKDVHHFYCIFWVFYFTGVPKTLYVLLFFSIRSWPSIRILWALPQVSDEEPGVLSMPSFARG